MHDYTGRILHDDKMRQLYREAADSRLAALARPPRWTARVRAIVGFREVRVSASRWLRGDPVAHGHGGRLGTRTNPELAENA